MAVIVCPASSMRVGLWVQTIYIHGGYSCRRDCQKEFLHWYGKTYTPVNAAALYIMAARTVRYSQSTPGMGLQQLSMHYCVPHASKCDDWEHNSAIHRWKLLYSL